jgi:hypothetical protein
MQKRVTGSCGVGNYIRVIGANGTVSCGADGDSGGDITSVTTAAESGLAGGDDTGGVALRLAGGYYSIGYYELQRMYDDETGKCLLRKSGYAYFLDTSTVNLCSAQAPVHLPDHAKIQSIDCLVRKSAGAHALEVKLQKIHLNAPNATSIVDLSLGADSATAAHITASLGTPEEIDNQLYAYFITYNPQDTRTDGNDKRFYDCKIEYSFQ